MDVTELIYLDEEPWAGLVETVLNLGTKECVIFTSAVAVAVAALPQPQLQRLMTVAVFSEIESVTGLGPILGMDRKLYQLPELRQIQVQ
jgi:hypothetical protein